ncbi:MAG: hypothetical protein DHS80DRAFT_6185, partial [Piptocephalis tieghemiana]
PSPPTNLSSLPSPSHPTDFTKRRNWSNRVISDLPDFLHVISPQSILIYASPASLELLGYLPLELVGHDIRELIHPEDIDSFNRSLEASWKGAPFRLCYRLRKRDDRYTTLEVTGNPVIGPDHSQCFVANARPYPTRATANLDEYIEIRAENDRLKRRILELGGSLDSVGPVGRSPASISDSRPIPVPVSSPTPTTIPAGFSHDSSSVNAFSVLLNSPLDSYTSFSPQATASSSAAAAAAAASIGLGLEGLDTTSPAGKVAASTASPSAYYHARLGHGPYPHPHHAIYSGTKFIGVEKVCTGCGTLESPEWRKGPNGPKTLCNACGLRWAKKTKKP